MNNWRYMDERNDRIASFGPGDEEPDDNEEEEEDNDGFDEEESEGRETEDLSELFPEVHGRPFLHANLFNSISSSGSESGPEQRKDGDSVLHFGFDLPIDPISDPGNGTPPPPDQPGSVIDTYATDPLFRALRDEMVFLRTMEEPILTRREGFTFLQETLEFVWGAICSGDTQDEAVAILNNSLVRLAAYALLVVLEPEN